jgi:hypothetical protein
MIPMIAGATPRELALVTFLLVLVVIHSVVPRIGEAIGGLFERGKRKTDGEPTRSEGG